MKLTRILSLVAALALLMTCLLMAGCSTPEYAIDTTAINGKKYTTADYLAYVYAIMSTDSTASTYLYYLGEEAFDMDVTYEEETMTLKEYLLTKAKDTIVRQAVLETMLKDNNLTWDEEDLKEIEDSVKDLSTDAFLALGFNNQRYIDMVKATGLNESGLFFGLYGEGGSREVPEADIRTFFEENHRSFKIVEISLVNSDKSEMTDDEIKKIEERMQKYLDAFNASEKTGADFDKLVYAPYLADEEAAKESTTTTTTGGATTTTAADATTTVATTTTTVASTTADEEQTTTTTTTTSTGTGSTTETDEEEEETTAQRYDMFEDDFSDEDLFKAVSEVEVGTAAIKTYQKSGQTKTMALIFRMDSEAERTEEDEDGNITEVDYYEENHDVVLQYMKYEEFDKEVDEKIAEVADKVIYNNRALKSPRLKEMAQLVFGI